MGTMIAEVIRTGILDMQVCVPAEMSDEAVEAFALEESGNV